MAGDWMKIELELPDKPEIHYIAGVTNLDPDAVVGKLIRVWQWFNKHTTDGNAVGVTFLLVDRISGVTGFGEAMQFAGWLVQNDKTLSMPKFDRHTSESAKARASTAKRVAKCKAKSNAEGNANTVTNSLPTPLPREEKRRVNISTDVDMLIARGVDAQAAQDFVKLRKAKRAPITETALQGIESEAAKAGISLDAALRVCCANGWQSFKAHWDWEGKGNSKPSVADDRRRATEELTGRKNHGTSSQGERVIDAEVVYVAGNVD